MKTFVFGIGSPKSESKLPYELTFFQKLKWDIRNWIKSLERPKKSRIPLFSKVTGECDIFTRWELSKYWYYYPELRLISRIPLYYDWIDRDFSKPKKGSLFHKDPVNKFIRWYKI